MFHICSTNAQKCHQYEISCYAPGKGKIINVLQDHLKILKPGCILTIPLFTIQSENVGLQTNSLTTTCMFSMISVKSESRHCTHDYTQPP